MSSCQRPDNNQRDTSRVVSVSLSARTTGLIDDETLIDLDDAEPATLDPGLDITGQIARQDDDVPAETGQ